MKRQALFCLWSLLYPFFSLFFSWITLNLFVVVVVVVELDIQYFDSDNNHDYFYKMQIAKGGVGKTTSVANLGLGLAMRNYRVCLVDFDIGLRNLDLHLVRKTSIYKNVWGGGKLILYLCHYFFHSNVMICKYIYKFN